MLLALFCSAAMSADEDPFAPYAPGAEPPASLVEQIRSSPEHRIEILERAARSAEHPLTESLRDAYRGHAAKLEHPTIYAVEAHVDADAWKIESHIGLVYTNTEDTPVRELVFRVFPNAFGSVEVKEMQSTDRGVRFQLDGTLLKVQLGARLDPGQRLRLYMEIVTPVPEAPPASALPDLVNATATGSYGRTGTSVNLGYWLPLLTHRHGDSFEQRPLPAHGEHAWHDPATFHVVLDVPASYAVATTGVRQLEAKGAEGRRVGIYTASGVREFAVHLGSGHGVIEKDVGGVAVRVFHAPDDAGAMRVAEAAASSLAWFQEKFGPYRYRELDVVRTPVRIALGTEYPGLVTIDTGLEAEEAEWTVAHEVAHQWWYAEVGNDGRAAPWIDESLASYSAALYIGHVYGEKEMESRMMVGLEEGCRAMYDDKLPDLPANLDAERYNLWNYGVVVYARGSVFWHEVHKEIGDEAFFQALQNLYRRNLGGSVDADRLLAPFRETPAGAEPVDRLYARWIAEGHCFEDVLKKPKRKIDKLGTAPAEVHP